MNDLFSGSDPQSDSLRDEFLNKWKDKPPEDVLKAKVEADLHIRALEREKAELREMYAQQREELLAKAKFEELIDRMNKPQDEVLVTPTPVNAENQKPFDPTEIEKIFENKISAYEQKKIEAANYSKVQEKLKERYGDNFTSVLKDQQSNLGLSNEDVNSLAKKSPEAFFRIMGLNEPMPRDIYSAPPRSNQRNDSFAPKVVRRDWNYYQELKKTNPMLYLDPKISSQMEKDAQELGSAFGMPSD